MILVSQIKWNVVDKYFLEMHLSEPEKTKKDYENAVMYQPVILLKFVINCF